MKTVLIITSVFVYALMNVTGAAADAPIVPDELHVSGSRMNTHLPEPKPAQTCTDNSNRPVLSYYLDGDTPYDTAVSDYLSDLAWWIEQTPRACNVMPKE